MACICVKKLSLGGKYYYPGDTIPDGVILPGRVDKLKASGYIAARDTAAPEPASTSDPAAPPARRKRNTGNGGDKA